MSIRGWVFGNEFLFPWQVLARGIRAGLRAFIEEVRRYGPSDWC